MAVRIVTDSVSSVPPDVAAELDIDVVPMHVVLDGEELLDGIDIDAAGFYARLPTVEHTSTSAPSAGEYLERYEAAAAAGYDAVLVLPLAERLSASCGNARLAARDAPLHVEVVDTGTAAAAQYLVVTAAARAARDAGETDEALARAVARATTAMTHTELIGVVPLLERLERQSGRVARVLRSIGGRAELLPLITIRGSSVRPAGVTRHLEVAIDRMSAAVRDAGPCRAAVTHAGVPERAAVLAERIRGTEGVEELVTLGFTPVMGAHTGLGVLGVAWEVLSPGRAASSEAAR